MSIFKDDERIFIGDTLKWTKTSNQMYTSWIWKDNVQHIIWHPVMIGDVLERVRENDIIVPDLCLDLDDYHWQNWLNKPIDDQDDNTIDFIYSLVK